MAESLEEALADEERRAVRDMLRDDGRWTRLVAVPVETYADDEEPPHWQLRVLDAARREPPYRPPARGELAARILLALIFGAFLLALAWAARGGL